MPVRSLEAWTLRLPLRRPVVFASMRYDHRDYAVVRVTDTEGRTGAAYCLARNAPLAATVAAMAPAVVGADVWATEQIWSRLYQASIPFGQRGLALRALSLVDVALWDLKGVTAGLSVSQLLGVARTEVQVGVGGGYYRDARQDDDVADELRGYRNLGFPLVKIPAGGWPPEREERWVAAARDAVGVDVQLAVDTHWTWSDTAEALAVLRRLDPYRLAWVEDPLWPEAVPALAALRRGVATPLAIGDELSGRWAYHSLLREDAADIWRVDVMTVGGFTEFRRVAALAETAGLTVATHIYPEVHVHCAGSFPSVRWTEYVAPETEIDLAHVFVEPLLEPHGGVAQVPSRPGLGVTLDWERIERDAAERYTTPAAPR